MPTSLSERVRAFVAEQCGVPLNRIEPPTTLFGDLGVDGDDAVQFFQAFAREFEVDVSGLDLTRHFGPEGVWPWEVVYSIILALWKRRKGTPEQKARLDPIMVQDLISAASSRAWPGLEGSAATSRYAP
jgi:acyl carrier protein